MPPKKKAARLPKPPSTPSEGAGDNIREEALTPAKADGPRDAIAPDVWTDDQETVLFKSMIQCKPVGSFLCLVREEASRSVPHLAWAYRSFRDAQTFSHDTNIGQDEGSRLQRVHITQLCSYEDTRDLGEIGKLV